MIKFVDNKIRTETLGYSLEIGELQLFHHSFDRVFGVCREDFLDEGVEEGFVVWFVAANDAIDVLDLDSVCDLDGDVLDLDTV